MEPSTTLQEGGFHNVLNFRDVGATVNARLGRKLIREGLLFRSARPDEADPADRTRLRDHYGLRTVVDLRSKTEHMRADEKRAADAKNPVMLRSNEALSGPVKMPGVEYREVKITGPGFERHMLRQLSWTSFLKLIFLYTIGSRTAAISILGREVMTPRGLQGLAADTLDASGPEVAEALRALLDPPGLPALVHCTQGKDRTGLIVALVLLILLSPDSSSSADPTDDAVAVVGYDYALTDERLAEGEPPAQRADRLAEIQEMGLGEEFGRTADGFVEGVVRHLREKYGGMGAYLDKAGFSRAERTALREKLLC